MSELDDFIRNAPPAPPFMPHVSYCAEDDRVESWWANEDYFVEQVTPCIKVCRSMKTREIVGVKLHGVKNLVAALDAKKEPT